MNLCCTSLCHPGPTDPGMWLKNRHRGAARKGASAWKRGAWDCLTWMDMDERQNSAQSRQILLLWVSNNPHSAPPLQRKSYSFFFFPFLLFLYSFRTHFDLFELSPDHFAHLKVLTYCYHSLSLCRDCQTGPSLFNSLHLFVWSPAFCLLNVTGDLVKGYQACCVGAVSLNSWKDYKRNKGINCWICSLFFFKKDTMNFYFNKENH